MLIFDVPSHVRWYVSHGRSVMTQTSLVAQLLPSLRCPFTKYMKAAIEADKKSLLTLDIFAFKYKQ